MITQDIKNMLWECLMVSTWAKVDNNFFSIFAAFCEDSVSCNGKGRCKPDGKCKCDENYFGANCESKCDIILI